MVDSLSNGRIGYIHIKEMNSESFRKTFSLLLGKYRNHEAVLIDTRHNGGGWLHEDLAILLSGKEFQQFAPRGQYIGSDPFSQWTKPSAVLVCEDNYSNAHGFPTVYKALGLGKLIGAPVPGTMTAVWWETQIDQSIVFGVPQVAVRDMQGRYLENQLLMPDIEVYNSPEDYLKGRDRQIEAGVKHLLEEIDGKR
jgi:C-terminal processing protease CtpA/Prc